jgi:hypothetical protein
MRKRASFRRPKRQCRVLAVFAAITTVTLRSVPALAEEGGSGHYFPGSISSFIDGVPQTPTFLMRLDGLYYTGSATATKRLPFAGVAALGPQADVWGAALTMLWRPPIEFGEHWSYAMAATIPYLRSNVSADLSASFASGPSASISRSSTTYGLGDIVLMPLMLNYNFNPDFNINFRTAIYAPTGAYQVGRLSNTGKNYWTVEPIVGFMYFGQTNGIEVSVYVGSDFNTENNATHYTSGTQFHVDGTVAQHFPFLGGISGVGISAYDYRQVAPDSGTGANLGSFMGGSIGLGPAFSYIGKIGTHDAIVELKWLHEVQTHNRLQGDSVLLKAVYTF